MTSERIVAVALLTQGDLNVLGPTFSRAWPVEDSMDFEELLRAIDQAERKLGRASKGSGYAGEVET